VRAARRGCQSSVVSRRSSVVGLHTPAGGDWRPVLNPGRVAPATAPVGRPQLPWAGHSPHGPATAPVGRPQHPWAGHSTRGLGTGPVGYVPTGGAKGRGAARHGGGASEILGIIWRLTFASIGGIVAFVGGRG